MIKGRMGVLLGTSGSGGVEERSKSGGYRDVLVIVVVINEGLR